MTINGGMHTRVCIQREGHTDIDDAGKMEGCMGWEEGMGCMLETRAHAGVMCN
jgi:hypothetical protein